MIQVKTLNRYQELTERTAPAIETDEEVKAMVNFALGLAGEGGEVGDYIKKVVFHGHTLDKSRVGKELGDILWYVARMAKLMGYTLQDIAEMNVEKLAIRYPKGFEPERSINRKPGDL